MKTRLQGWGLGGWCSEWTGRVGRRLGSGGGQKPKKKTESSEHTEQYTSDRTGDVDKGVRSGCHFT